MTPKVNLGFGLIIALIVPGGVLLFLVLLAPPAFLDSELTQNFKNLSSENESMFILLASLIAIALGLTLDVLRFLITWIIARNMDPEKRSRYDITKLDSEVAISAMNWIN